MKRRNTKTKRTDRTDQIFGEIATGLSEAVAYARDPNAKGFKAHIPETVDVRAVRARLA